MAKGDKPDFDVFVSEKNGDNKNHYTRVGAAWSFDKDGVSGISVKLAANIAVSGGLVLFVPSEDGG